MQLSEAIRLLQPAGIDPTVPQRWADLGSGEYLFTHALASLLAPGSTIYAVDRIAMPPEKGDVNIVPIRADFEQDDFLMEPLDGILMANSLHYVADQAAFLRTLQRFFKADPYFILVEYDTEKAVPVWVPHPLSFRRLQSVAETLGYGEVTRLGDYSSQYGGVMYAAAMRS
ncbi:class I SAM-dependent methyltransferase [Chitinophaga lutea]